MFGWIVALAALAVIVPYFWKATRPLRRKTKGSCGACPCCPTPPTELYDIMLLSRKDDEKPE